MNYANLSLAKTEIIKQLGYFPAFLIPAINSSLIYQSLVQQTLFAYINNPLPSQFKEKLFVLLSHYFGLNYFTICHSCTLRSLSLSATDILALGRLKVPQSELEMAAEIEILQQQGDRDGWQNSPELEDILLRCSSLIFLHPEETANLSAVLQKLLGTVYYHYLIVFLGYIKLCHQWVRSNPSIEHQQDRRSQLHLGSLLLEKIELVQFFQSEVKSPVKFSPVTVDRSSISSDSLSPAIASHDSIVVSLPQLKQKTLNTCLANAPFPVMIHNQQGEIIHLNRNWLEASGYDSQEISTLDDWNRKAQIRQREIVKLPTKNSSRAYRKYVAPAHKTAIEATTALQQIVNSLIDIAPEVSKINDRATKKPTDTVRSEVTVATKNGEQLNWELYSTALSFESEADELIISIAKDMTELVNQEAKLAEVEAKLRLVLEATKTGNWSWDLNTNKIYACHRGRNILGLENFDGSYQSFIQSIHPQERESIDLEIAKAVQAHQDLDIKYSVVKPTQEIAQIQIKGKLNYSLNGKPASITGIVIDLTSIQQSLCLQNNRLPLVDESVGDRKASSKNTLQTAKSLSTLRNVIDLLPYYLFVVDLNTETISSINSSLVDSFSLTKEQVIGQKPDRCFPPEYAKQIRWLHQQVVTYQKAVHVQEEVALADGNHYLDTIVTPLIDETGNTYALLHTSSNIPELAEAQEALSQRTLQLEAANRELESFSYSVSHDLQAPLRIINGFSQVLWENYHSNLDNRGQHYLQRIQANSKRMSDLIDALLQLSRVTRSQMKPINVNLSTIAEDIIRDLQGDNPQRQVEVEVTPNLKTKGDPQLLRIVLCNLLHNAWKYTSRKTYSRIEFGVVTENVDRPTYFVRDNGAGFDSNYADKLFTAFQRLHNQSEFPGTGIGLATVQRIIYRHGGKVWAEGECDRGATIYFSL